HVFAFLRHLDGAAALAVVPRLPVGLVPDASRPPLGRRVGGGTGLGLPAGGGPGRGGEGVTRGGVTDTNKRGTRGRGRGRFPGGAAGVPGRLAGTGFGFARPALRDSAAGGCRSGRGGSATRPDARHQHNGAEFVAGVGPRRLDPTYILKTPPRGET